MEPIEIEGNETIYEYLNEEADSWNFQYDGQNSPVLEFIFLHCLILTLTATTKDIGLIKGMMLTGSRLVFFQSEVVLIKV